MWCCEASGQSNSEDHTNLFLKPENKTQDAQKPSLTPKHNVYKLYVIQLQHASLRRFTAHLRHFFEMILGPCLVKRAMLLRLFALCLPSAYLLTGLVFFWWARFIFPSPSSFDRVSRCPLRPDRPWPNDGFASGSCGSCLILLWKDGKQILFTWWNGETNSIAAVAKRCRRSSPPMLGLPVPFKEQGIPDAITTPEIVRFFDVGCQETVVAMCSGFRFPEHVKHSKWLSSGLGRRFGDQQKGGLFVFSEVLVTTRKSQLSRNLYNIQLLPALPCLCGADPAAKRR